MNSSPIILLVGPSGVGKTSAFQAITNRFPECVFDHLDGLASRRGVRLGLIEYECVTRLRQQINDPQLFLAFGLEAIGEFHAFHPDRHIIVDIGAGFQSARFAQYLSRIHTVVAIVADPEVAYRRFTTYRGAREMRDFMNQEFSRHRRLVYSSADRQIDTTNLSLEETAEALTEAIARIVRGT